MFFFFFKQKTAYEVRISDWISDVCSSDLLAVGLAAYFAFGWLGVGAVAVFVLIVFFGKDPPTEQTGPRRKGKGLNLNDDPNPWYMQSQYRFGSGNSAAHNRWHK